MKFRYLPDFARFLKQEKLEDYIRVQLRYSRELKLPLLRFFEGMTEDALIELSRPGQVELLDALIDGSVKEHIREANRKWFANQLQLVDKYDISAEDISLVSFIRKKAMVAFLPEYSGILADALAIISEIDQLGLEMVLHSTNTFISILKDKISEHSHFIGRIAETSPGIIYVYDLRQQSTKYVNRTVAHKLGYETDEWLQSQEDFVDRFIHPDDISLVRSNFDAFRSAADDEIRSISFRIKDASGGFRWMRTYESVFRRDPESVVSEVIGIALDITDEKHTADRLQLRESELLEAQELASIGSFVWNLSTDSREATPQCYRILGVEKGMEPSEFLELVHPGDRKKMREGIERMTREHQPLDFEFRVCKDNQQKIVWMKATVGLNQKSEAVVRGTVMDVTERQYMVQKLQRSESINKIAQSLTHIGNWSWDLMQDKLEWSDELYRIYGLEPGEPVSSVKATAFHHPDDAVRVASIILESRERQQPYDFYFRIISKDGVLKTVHAVGETLYDEEGKAYKMIGTLQDVTEREEMISRLRNSEILYKQAQSLSHIGNWRWNIRNGELEWSDEMYRIYGLAPQSEKITIQRFLRFIHPEDLGYIERKIAEPLREKYDDIFRIITDTGDEKVVHSIAELQYDNEGQPHYIIGTEQDVTEKEKLIEELQTSRELYKQSLEISRIGNWTWSVKGDVISWDEQTYRNFGLEPFSEELTLETYLARVPEEERESLKTAIFNCYNHHEPYDITHSIIWPDGQRRYIHSKGEVLLDENGEVFRMIGTAQDVTEREQMVRRLQRSEALYKQAQSIAHLGNWILEVDSGKIYWTDELYRIFGLEPQSVELNQDNFSDYVHPEDRELVAGFVSESMKTGKPFDLYFRNVRKTDGAIRTLHSRGEGLMNEEGHVFQLLGTCQDVTEQQKIEQELRSNQNFIKKIADATPSVIASYNINSGRYSFVSQGLKSLLGYEPEEALQGGIAFFTALVHPDDLEALMEKNSKALEWANQPENEDQELIVDFQYRAKRSDGEYRWIHTFGTIFDRNSQGKVENILNISIDITERVIAEQTVAEQRRFISHIAEASPTILYLFDLEQQRFLYLNKEVTAVLGYTPEEILALGDKVYMYLHPEDTIKSPDTYVKYKQEDGVTMHQFEGRIRSRSGEWKWLLTREVVFLRNAAGEATQVLGSALDITDRKEMERRLSKKNLELEQSNASLEEFAYVASHDLQEPLRKISIFGDRLLSNHKDKLEEDGRIFLQKIVDSSARMQAMINDLLSVSLISGDKSFQQVSLLELLNEVLQTLEFKIETTGATIRYSALPGARVIRSQMRQLLQNLISNSLKFIPSGRSPEIEISHSFLSAEEVNHYALMPGKRYLKLVVTDNGIGFDNEYASKIFIIFQRLHGRFEYEGTGIGLAICKKIVENHEGVIFAEGKPGQGASFTVIIPE
ncbi:MAG TPA: PAS domain-containing protein [Chitinophagaceae bacterium]